MEIAAETIEDQDVVRSNQLLEIIRREMAKRKEQGEDFEALDSWQNTVMASGE
jgi:hypothetical protein